MTTAVQPMFQFFEPLPADEYAALKADIAKRGVLVPIEYDEEGNILDGHHRHRICQELGIKDFPRVVRRFSSLEEKEEHVVALNVRRRHLTNEQKRKWAEWFLRRHPEWSNRRIATEVGLSDPTVAKVREELEAAGELLKISSRVGRDGRHRPSTQPKPAPPPSVFANSDEQAKRAQQALLTLGEQAPPKMLEVRDVERAARQKEREERTAALTQRAREIDDDSPVQVRQMDCMDLIASLDDGSVSLLLTDPPYNVTDHEWDTWPSDEEYWRFTREWLAAMRPKMAGEFTAFVFCGADASPQMHQALVDTGWPVLRQAIWHRPNLAKKRSGSMTFLSSYEPFWHAGTRGLFLPDEWGEERFDVQRFVVPQSTHTTDPSYHPTQKPLGLFRRLVSIGSLPGELVVDPFVGAGTTAVACQMEGRRCLAGDQSAKYVQITLGRLAQAREAA